MSTSTEISRLTAARNTIRNKLVNLGLGESTDLLDDLATEINAIENQGAVTATVKEGETYTIPAGYHNGSGTVSGVSGGGNYTLQSKGPITPTKSTQSITADNGYYGLSGVSIAAIPEAYQDVSSVTAAASEVLANKVFVETDGSVTAGTMPNIGAVSKVLDATTSNQTYTVPAGYHNGSGSVSIVLETKSATPTKESQDITPTNGKVLSKVTVNPIPSDYQDVSGVTATAADVLSGATFVSSTGTEVSGTIETKDSSDISITGDTITVAAGYYASSATSSIGEGALSASATGSATVSAVSFAYNSTGGNFTISGSSAISGSASATVETAGYVGSATSASGATTGTASVSATVAKIAGETAITGTKMVTPVISRTTTTATGATNVGSGTASTTKPTSGYFVSVKTAESTSTVTATPSVTTEGYGNGSYHGIAGATAIVGASAATEAYITVPGGSATTPATTISATPAISISTGGLITATVAANSSITPTVDDGYITAGTAGTVSVSGSNTSQLTTKAASTYYPSTSDQTVASQVYLTGVQTFKAVKLTAVSAANIKYGVTVKVGDASDDDRITSISGTFTAASTVSTGQTAASAAHILTGYSAWVDGTEVKGSIANNGAISGTIDGLTTTSYSVAAGYTSGGTVSLTNDIENALAAI